MKLPEPPEIKIYVDESDYLQGSDDLPPSDDVTAPFSPRRVELKKDDQSSANNYEFLEEIGEGKFGTVFRCREKNTGMFLAAKFIETKNNRARSEVEHEVSIMTRLQHPRIIQLYDAFASTSKETILIMELVEGGELFERVADDRFVLTELSAMQIMRQICDAMAFIHEQHIVHLDMKPENILCLTKQSNRIKLIDFGLAQEYKEGDDLKVIAGTAEFIAPEVISFEKVDYKSDMWSIGVICYILLSGLSPFLGDTVPETYGNVTKGDWDFDDEGFKDVSDMAQDFISLLLVYKREGRLSSKDCLSHPWLSRDESHSAERILRKQRLKRYVIKRRWKKALTAICVVIRLGWSFSQLLNRGNGDDSGVELDINNGDSPVRKLKRMGITRELTDYIVSQFHNNQSAQSIKEEEEEFMDQSQPSTSEVIEEKIVKEVAQSKLSIKAEELKIAIEKLECRRTESGTDSGIEGDQKSRSVSCDDFKFTPIASSRASPVPLNSATSLICDPVMESTPVPEYSLTPADSEPSSEIDTPLNYVNTLHTVIFSTDDTILRDSPVACEIARAETLEPVPIEVTMDAILRKPARKMNKTVNRMVKVIPERATITVKEPKKKVKKIASKPSPLTDKIQVRKIKQEPPILKEQSTNNKLASEIEKGIKLKKTLQTLDPDENRNIELSSPPIKLKPRLEKRKEEESKSVRDSVVSPKSTLDLPRKSEDVSETFSLKRPEESLKVSPKKSIVKPKSPTPNVTSNIVPKKTSEKPKSLNPTLSRRKPKSPLPPLPESVMFSIKEEPKPKWSPFPTPITSIQKSASSAYIPRVKLDVSNKISNLVGQLQRPNFGPGGLQKSASQVRILPKQSNTIDPKLAARPMHFWKAMEVTNKPMSQSMHVDFSGKEVITPKGTPCPTPRLIKSPTPSKASTPVPSRDPKRKDSIDKLSPGKKPPKTSSPTTVKKKIVKKSSDISKKSVNKAETCDNKPPRPPNTALWMGFS